MMLARWSIKSAANAGNRLYCPFARRFSIFTLLGRRRPHLTPVGRPLSATTMPAILSCEMPTTGSACSAPARVTSDRALEAVLHVCRRNRARAAIRLFFSCHALFGSKSLWLKRQLGKDRGPAAAEYSKSRQAILERKIGITLFCRGPKFG